MFIHSSFNLLFIHSHLLSGGCTMIAQSGLTLCDPMVYTVHGILQARILEWVAFPFSRGSSQSRDRAQVSRIGGFFLYQLSHKGSPGRLKWVADPFSSRSSWPRNRTCVSCTSGRFFTSWAIREALHIYQFSLVQSLSCVWLSATTWTVVRQASLFITDCQTLLILMSIKSVM